LDTLDLKMQKVILKKLLRRIFYLLTPRCLFLLYDAMKMTFAEYWISDKPTEYFKKFDEIAIKVLATEKRFQALSPV